MISVSVGDFVSYTVHVLLFIGEIKEMEKRIYGCQDESYSCSCSIDASEGILIGSAGQVDKL